MYCKQKIEDLKPCILCTIKKESTDALLLLEEQIIFERAISFIKLDIAKEKLRN